MLTREERPCVGLAIGETQDYSSWGDLSSSCNMILRCRMNRRQGSLLSYSSSTSTPNISITNNKMCNRATALAIIQSYKVDGIIRHLNFYLRTYIFSRQSRHTHPYAKSQKSGNPLPSLRT